MAEDQDDSQKTEDPSQKRLSDAREKGDGIKSQEVTSWLSLATATLVLATFAPGTASKIGADLTIFLSAPETFDMTGGGQALAGQIIYKIGVAMALPIVLLIAGALVGNMLQQRPTFNPGKLALKFDKLSPANGLKRMFGISAWANLAKSIVKFAVIGTICYVVLWPERHMLGALIQTDLAGALPIALKLAMKLMGAILAALALMAILDYAFQYHEFMKRNRMTKQEVKDEHRQMEGDPMVKNKIRQLRMEKARQRMMAKVPEATVVITNPTHFAVALKYESGKMMAPVCVAKGVDALALRIRALAEEHKVPVVENPPLARTLHATVELDQEVPPEHYKAVAAVIGYVMRLKRSYSWQ